MAAVDACSWVGGVEWRGVHGKELAWAGTMGVC